MVASHTPKEIGEALGISRQRVYQILAEDGIDYHSHQERHRRRQEISRNLARTLTQPIANVDKHRLGGICEILVAADLMALGWHPYIPLFRNHSHDIIATNNRKIITIEVRSASRRANASIRFMANTFGRHPSHFALVIPGEPVVYKPTLPQAEDEGQVSDVSC